MKFKTLCYPAFGRNPSFGRTGHPSHPGRPVPGIPVPGLTILGSPVMVKLNFYPGPGPGEVGIIDPDPGQLKLSVPILIRHRIMSQSIPVKVK